MTRAVLEDAPKNQVPGCASTNDEEHIKYPGAPLRPFRWVLPFAMKAHYLSLAIAAGLLMHLTSPASATPTVVRSPETADTYADNSILWHQLRWLPASHQVVATITFSNVDYVSRIEPRHDETYTFPLPGVKFSADTGVFSLVGAHGQAIPVAQLHADLIGHSVELLPTARVLVTKRSGHIVVRLLADQAPSDGDRWVER